VRNSIFIFCFLLVGGVIRLTAQDADLSMMYLARMYYNPAFAGVEEGRASMAFRDHYPGSDAAFVTAVASWDQQVEFLHGGYGVMVMHDRSAGGMMTLTGLSLTYSYHLQISRTLFLNSGFTASLMQNHFNADGLILPDMISPSGGVVLPPGETIVSESHFFPDFTVGFLLYSKNWSGAVAAWHLMQPYRSEVKNDQSVLKRKYTVLLSYTFQGRDGLSFVPWGGGMIQGRSQLYLVGGQVNYKFVSAGVAWKKSFGNQYDVAVIAIGLGVGNMRFMYSYDAFINTPPGRTGGGAHEAGIVMELAKSRHRKTIIFPQL